MAPTCRFSASTKRFAAEGGDDDLIAVLDISFGACKDAATKGLPA
jgi:hypothetical protein